MRPDGEVAGAAGQDRVAGQTLAEERHDLAEVDGPAIGSCREVLLVVGAGRGRVQSRQRGSTGVERRSAAANSGRPQAIAQLGLVDAAELVRVGMRVHERLPRARNVEQRVAARRRSRRAGRRARRGGRPRARRVASALVHRDAESPAYERRAVVDVVLAAEGAGDGQRVRLAEARARSRAVSARPAALADDHERALGRGEQLPQPRQVLVARRRPRGPDAAPRRERPPPRRARLRAARARPGPGRPESASENARSTCSGRRSASIDLPGRTSRGRRTPRVVDLLPGLAALERARHLADEQDQRRRVLLRGVHADRRVRRARPARDEADPRAAGELAVGLGRVRGPCLVAARRRAGSASRRARRARAGSSRRAGRRRARRRSARAGRRGCGRRSSRARAPPRGGPSPAAASACPRPPGRRSGSSASPPTRAAAAARGRRPCPRSPTPWPAPGSPRPRTTPRPGRTSARAPSASIVSSP